MEQELPKIRDKITAQIIWFPFLDEFSFISACASLLPSIYPFARSSTVEVSEEEDLWLVRLGGNTPRLNKPVKTKKRVHRWGGHYWFDSMEEHESLPAIDAAFFDALEGPDCMVPEPVTKKICKSCKRNLSEVEHFIPGKKTCHECLKKQRNYMRKKRRKERRDEILNKQ